MADGMAILLLPGQLKLENNIFLKPDLTAVSPLLQLPFLLRTMRKHGDIKESKNLGRTVSYDFEIYLMTLHLLDVIE
jgi:hypothetical protein